MSGRGTALGSVAESLRILGVGDAKSRRFARWATRLAERGHEVHIASGRYGRRNLREVHARFGDPPTRLEQVYQEVLER